MLAAADWQLFEPLNMLTSFLCTPPSSSLRSPGYGWKVEIFLSNIFDGESKRSDPCMPLYAPDSFLMPFQDFSETETQDCVELQSVQFSHSSFFYLVGKVDPKS